MSHTRELDRRLPSVDRTGHEGARRGDRPMSSFMKVAFWFVAANALVGAGSLIFFPADTARLFFWGITPPINAALFGALYLGGAAVVALVTYRGRWEPARFLVPILVSAGALITLTTLIHLDRFSPGPRLAAWLVVYVGAPLLALLFYVQHERSGANWAIYWPVTGLPAFSPRGRGCPGAARGSRPDLAWPRRGTVALAHHPADGPDLRFLVCRVRRGVALVLGRARLGASPARGRPDGSGGRVGPLMVFVRRQDLTTVGLSL